MTDRKGLFSLQNMPTSHKLGILRLGRVAGKMKYSLIDGEDIALVEQFVMEARIDVDRNGHGATIYAYALDTAVKGCSGQKLHHLLWEVRRGGVAVGWKVIHRNHVTLDNRQENLCLVRECEPPPPPAAAASVPGLEVHEVMSGSGKNGEGGLYWTTILRLMSDPVEQDIENRQRLVSAVRYEPDGRVLDSQTDTGFMYFECHYPPCSTMEQELRQFSICGRCQLVRYCGHLCQQRDWPYHKFHCKEKSWPRASKSVDSRHCSPER